MPVRHPITAATRRAGGLRALGSACATLWALAMGVLGVWLLAPPEGSGVIGAITPAARIGLGATLLSGGQLVFLILVADRAFPRTPIPFVRTVEGGLACLGAGACVVSAYGLAAGGAS
mgnify:CR=1 FL=1